ncbi:MAG TPA: TlyA family RNA methyltransferase [Spirochaetota bacterium]|nr:TlyA family RNA methyltransferase [Spirochaetota bacterium]
MERIDKHLAQSGLSSTREQAKKEILAGWVKINGETCLDVSRKVEGIENITVSRPKGLFVSRGGYKLEKALNYFNIDVSGLTVLDLGASTGGFSDCMLKRGASFVYAVDVGYGQLDYSLRIDKRVEVMERTNARNLTIENFEKGIPTFVSADLSFISFTKVFPVIRGLFKDIKGVALIKPQFEAQRGEHKKGVVKSSSVHLDILTRVLTILSDQGCSLSGLTHSPVTGPKGNIEFLLYFSLVEDSSFDLSSIEDIVKCAWDELKEKS